MPASALALRAHSRKGILFTQCGWRCALKAMSHSTFLHARLLDQACAAFCLRMGDGPRSQLAWEGPRRVKRIPLCKCALKISADAGITCAVWKGPYCLHKPRAIGERGFANRSFSYIAPHLYNKLPITIKLIDSLNSFKSHLKAFLFSRAYDRSGLAVQEDYAL